MVTMPPEELWPDPAPSNIRFVIAASSVGTLFEWVRRLYLRHLVVDRRQRALPGDPLRPGTVTHMPPAGPPTSLTWGLCYETITPQRLGA